MRSGTRSACKRRYRQRGQRPQCKMKLGYEYCYLYAALQPFTGEMIALLLPDMTKESFSLFIDHFKQQTQKRYGSEQVLLITDGAGAHQKHMVQGTTIVMEKLPPASPELNPVERFFEELRKEMANQIFDTIAAVEDKLCEVMKKYYDHPNSIISLTNYPYLSIT